VRFFERGVPREERSAILLRYDVSYLLVARRLADTQADPGELQPFGRVVYSSRDYVLLQVAPAFTPAGVSR
jgi:hypothetical protein